MDILTKEDFKAESMKLLRFMDKKCKENNVQYFLHAGTLLGSVRHGGFIPWDDDVDICMTRQNYIKFMSVFTEDDEYILESYENNRNWRLPYGKVRYKKTLRMDSATNKPVMPEQGLDIDIFIIDGYSSNRIIRNMHFRIQNFIFNSLYKRSMVWNDYSGWKKAASRLLNSRFLSRLVYLHAGLWKAENSEYAGCMVGLYRGKMELAKATGFLKSIDGTFEGEFFPIPCNYDEVLCSLYGRDYMTPPPIDKRTSTHTSYLIWRK